MIPQANPNSQITELDKPMTLKIAGQNRVFTSVKGIFSMLRQIEQDEKSYNLKAARSVFDLGQALILVKEKLQYGTIGHLYNDANINRRRAQRAVKWANDYATPEGEFDTEKYREGELTARNRHESGERPCKFDSENHPSFTAVQEAVGHRSASKPKVETVEHETVSPAPFNPLASMASLANQHAIKAPELKLTQPSKEWVANEQLTLDFDLLATERRLADAIKIAERNHTDGTLSSEHAMQINTALESLTKQITEISQSDSLSSSADIR